MIKIWKKIYNKQKESWPLISDSSEKTITVLLCSKGGGTAGIVRAVRYANDLGVEYEISIEGKIYGRVYEKIISDHLTVEINKPQIITINNYRSIQLPSKVVRLDQSGSTLQLALILDDDKGRKLTLDHSLYLKLIYRDDGELIKLEVPGMPLVFDCQQLRACPVLTKYHDTIYTLPISNELYIDLAHRGVVKIGDDNPAYLGDYWA